MKKKALWLLSGCLVLACGAADRPLPVSFTCANGGIVSTSAGDRLAVTCSADVTAPPAECARQSTGSYLCNTYHADAAFCATFPGVCAGG